MLTARARTLPACYVGGTEGRQETWNSWLIMNTNQIRGKCLSNTKYHAVVLVGTFHVSVPMGSGFSDQFSNVSVFCNINLVLMEVRN